MQTLISSLSVSLFPGGSRKKVSNKVSPSQQVSGKSIHWSTPSKSSSAARFDTKYVLVDLLGVGGFGHIYTAIRKSDGLQVAAKFIKIKSVPASRWAVDETALVPAEVLILKMVASNAEDDRHEGVIGFHETFKTREYLIIVQELFGSTWSTHSLDRPSRDSIDSRDPTNHPFNSKITRKRCTDLYELREQSNLTEEQSQYIFGQVVDACMFLLRKGIVHGDIKEENILVDRQLRIKLIDFGGSNRIPSLSNSSRHIPRKSFFGTIEFAPPEVLKGNNASSSYDPELADVWSLGVLLFGLIYNQLPFKNPLNVIHGDFEDHPLVITESKRLVMHLIRRCLAKDPAKRIRLNDIASHPWFAQEF